MRKNIVAISAKQALQWMDAQVDPCTFHSLELGLSQTQIAHVEFVLYWICQANNKIDSTRVFFS